MQKLAKETAIYGVSSILGKFLNWLLMPFYTFVLAGGPSEYGIVTNLYAWTSLLLVVLTYGMETGFFRFVNKDKENETQIYGNVFSSIGFTSILFIGLILLFDNPISVFLGYANHPEYIAMMGITVALDAFASIPFAFLRYQNRPIKFAALKLLYVVFNILLNVFFLVVCPWLDKHMPGTIQWFYKADYGVGYVVVSNLIATILQTIILLFYTLPAKFKLSWILIKPILNYSLPLLILGIAGIMNQNLDKILIPFLLDGEYGRSQLGIYGAASKISMVMMMFTQAFRYAYEPMVFAQHKDKNSVETYADAMKYFILFSLLIFLGMVLYLDIFKLIIEKSYWEGLQILPIVLISFIFQGIYFNLSIWYKLKDKTIYGAWFSIIGTVIIVMGNIILVPIFSYVGSAWSALACYTTIMVISYFYGQKYLPVPYNLKSILRYALLTIALYVISQFIETPWLIVNLALKTLLLCVFIAYLIKNDFPLEKIPVLNKFIKRKIK